MSKNETLKAIREKLSMMEPQKDTIIDKAMQRLPEIYPMAFKYGVKEGKEVTTYWCTKCHTESQSDTRASRYGGHYKCPNCGNFVSGMEQNYVWIFNESDGVKYFIRFTPEITCRFGENEIFKSCKGFQLGASAPDTGLRVMLRGKLTRVDDISDYDRENRWWHGSVDPVPGQKNLLDAMFADDDTYRAIQSAATEASRQKKRNRAVNANPVPKTDPRLSMPLKSVDEALMSTAVPSVAFVASSADVAAVAGRPVWTNPVGNARTAYYFDGAARTTKEIAVVRPPDHTSKKAVLQGNIEDGNIEVPLETADHMISLPVFYYERTGNLTDSFLVRRCFNLHYRMVNGQVEVSAFETCRQYFTPEKVWEYEVDRQGVATLRKPKKRVPHPYSEGREHYVNAQSPSEISAIVAQTPMARCGFAEALKIDADLINNGYGGVRNTNYLDTWFVFPQIELFVKIGMSNLAKEILQDPDAAARKFNTEGTSPKDVLGVSKQTARWAQKMNLYSKQIYLLAHALETEPSIDMDTFDRLMRVDNADRVINTCHRPNLTIRLKDALDYFQRVVDYQFITLSSAIEIWCDYIPMAEAVGFDLQEKKWRFPISLKLRHDEATYLYNKLLKENPQTVFDLRSNDMQKLEWADKQSGLCVVAPKSTQDIIREGTLQNHCVASYVGPILEGKTIVMFIRHLDDIDRPFFTIEVKNAAIGQFHGFNNCDPPEDVKEFVRKWTAKKRIAYKG